MKNASACLTLLMLSALPAAAQETHEFGLDFTIGTSSQTLGATWHVTRRIALRPTFSYSHTSADSVQTLFASDGDVDATTSSTTESLGAGLEGMVFLTRTQSLSTYLAATYRRVHSSSRTDAPQVAVPLTQLPPILARQVASYLVFSSSSKSSGNSNAFGPAFGLQYEVGKHFSVFAEAGVSFSTATSTSERQPAASVSTTGPSHTKAIGTASASLGAIFYFN